MPPYVTQQPLLSFRCRIKTILERTQDRDPAGLIQDLCGLAAEIGDDAGDALLDTYPDLLKYSPALTEAFRTLVVTADVAECRRLLSTRFDRPVRFPDVASERSVASYNRTREVLDIVDFRSCPKVVVVGCGRRPFTAFHVRDKTTVPEIVGLDILPEAVETAARLSDWLGYTGLTFELCEGSQYDYSGANVVYVASMVSSKKDILSRIVETAPNHLQIIICEPYSLGRLWGEDIERNLDPSLEITHVGKRGYWSLTREIVLKRCATTAQ